MRGIRASIRWPALIRIQGTAAVLQTGPRVWPCARLPAPRGLLTLAQHSPARQRLRRPASSRRPIQGTQTLGQASSRAHPWFTRAGFSEDSSEALAAAAA